MIILAIIVLAWLPGWLLLALFYTRRPRFSLEIAFAALALGTAVTGWFALLLAEFNFFSRPDFLVVWLLLTVLLGFLAWRKRRSWQQATAATAVARETDQLPTWLEWIILGVWLIVAIWLFLRPHEYVIGAADAGVYLSLGADIAQQGGFIQTDTTLAALGSEMRAVVLRPLTQNPPATSYLLPGFYVTNEASGEITPQFYPLHPVWLAVAYSLAPTLLAGVQAELLMTGLWILLSCLAVYLVAREVGGWKTAVLTLLGLSLCGLQVWFARYPTTEALTQFLLWTGLWALMRWLDGCREKKLGSQIKTDSDRLSLKSAKIRPISENPRTINKFSDKLLDEREPSTLWAFLAGITLGLLFLVRIDIIVILPILALFALWRWSRGLERSDWFFFIPVAALFSHAMLHAVLQSAPYFYAHMGYGLLLLSIAWPLLVVALLAGLLFLWGVRRIQGHMAGLRRYRRAALGVLIGAVLIFALYGWFLRPVLNVTTFMADAYNSGDLPILNHENWRRLGWYLAPLGVWLGVLGSCLLIWRVERKTAVFLSIGFLFSAVYLWNVSANPVHVYVMRRYMPTVVPFFIISAAYLLSQLLDSLPITAWKNRRGAADHHGFGRKTLMQVGGVILTAAWLFGLAWSARGLISQVDHQGLLQKIDAFNAQLVPNSLLLFNDQAAVGQGDILGTPLRSIYGHDVFTMRYPEGVETAVFDNALTARHAAGQTIYWIDTPNGGEKPFSADLIPFDTYEIKSTTLERIYAHKPTALQEDVWAGEIFTVVPEVE